MKQGGGHLPAHYLPSSLPDNLLKQTEDYRTTIVSLVEGGKLQAKAHRAPLSYLHLVLSRLSIKIPSYLSKTPDQPCLLTP